MSHDSNHELPLEKQAKISFGNSFWLVIILVGLFIAALNFVQAESGAEEHGAAHHTEATHEDAHHGAATHEAAAPAEEHEATEEAAPAEEHAAQHEGEEEGAATH